MRDTVKCCPLGITKFNLYFAKLLKHSFAIHAYFMVSDAQSFWVYVAFDYVFDVSTKLNVVTSFNWKIYFGWNKFLG